MGLEQYIVRELKEDIKLLIKKVTELEKKLEEAHPSKEADTGSKPSTKGTWDEAYKVKKPYPTVKKVYTLSHDASGDVYTESKKMQDELEPIDDTESKSERVDDTFERYAGYREWNKTHDNYKILYSPTNTDEHGKKIKDD